MRTDFQNDAFRFCKLFDGPDQLNFARVLVFEQRTYLVLINVFFVLMGTVASIIGMSFFQLCFKF